MFYLYSTLSSCSSAGVFVPPPQYTSLCITISCFQSFRQKHLLCTCRSRKSDVWVVFPQISRITHIHCHPPRAAQPGAASGSEETWAHTHQLEEAAYAKAARLATSLSHIPDLVLLSMAHNTPGNKASSRPTFHTYPLHNGVRSSKIDLGMLKHIALTFSVYITCIVSATDCLPLWLSCVPSLSCQERPTLPCCGGHEACLKMVTRDSSCIAWVWYLQADWMEDQRSTNGVDMLCLPTSYV